MNTNVKKNRGCCSFLRLHASLSGLNDEYSDRDSDEDSDEDSDADND
jgi:hypothetical protein